MGITVLIAILSTIAVVLFQVAFTTIGANSYKKVYYQLLLELSKSSDDTELKERVIEAGNEYYSRIKFYGMGSVRGAVSSARTMRLIGPVDEKMIFEDMTRIVKINKH